MMLERERKDALIALVRADLAQGARNLGVVDLAPGPELREATSLRRLRQRQGDRPGPVADHALELEIAGQRAHLGRQRERLAAVEIGQHRRRGIGAGLRVRGDEIGDGGALELVDEGAHAHFDLVDRADMGERAAPELGGASHQE